LTVIQILGAIGVVKGEEKVKEDVRVHFHLCFPAKYVRCTCVRQNTCKPATSYGHTHAHANTDPRPCIPTHASGAHRQSSHRHRRRVQQNLEKMLAARSSIGDLAGHPLFRQPYLSVASLTGLVRVLSYSPRTRFNDLHRCRRFNRSQNYLD